MQRRLRVMSWNVRDLLGDPLAVHRVVRAAAPDVLCLQEAHRWFRSRPLLAALARRSGLLLVDGGRASAGTALLAGLRTHVQHAVAVRLPVHGRLTRPRGYAAATVSLPGTAAVRVASIHLGLDEAQRADHVQRVLGGLGDLPAVVAGDLNERPGGPSWRALGARAVDVAPDGAPTYPARAPRLRIDAVLVDPSLDVVVPDLHEAVDERDVVLASDHRPVVADVALPPR